MTAAPSCVWSSLRSWSNKERASLGRPLLFGSFHSCRAVLKDRQKNDLANRTIRPLNKKLRSFREDAFDVNLQRDGLFQCLREGMSSAFGYSSQLTVKRLGKIDCDFDDGPRSARSLLEGRDAQRRGRTCAPT